MTSNRSLLRAVARTSTSITIRSDVARSFTAFRLQKTAEPKSKFLRPSRQWKRVPGIGLEQWRQISATGEGESKIYDWKEVKSLVESPSDKTLLVDVREPHEYAEGFIPTALNIPIQSQPDALFLSPDEFEDRFGFAKPPPGKEIVFYCKAGVRSRAAAHMARQNGYENVGEYPGSWIDWVKNGGGAK